LSHHHRKNVDGDRERRKVGYQYGDFGDDDESDNDGSGLKRWFDDEYDDDGHGYDPYGRGFRHFEHGRDYDSDSGGDGDSDSADEKARRGVAGAEGEEYASEHAGARRRRRRRRGRQNQTQLSATLDLNPLHPYIPPPKRRHVDGESRAETFETAFDRRRRDDKRVWDRFGYRSGKGPRDAHDLHDVEDFDFDPRRIHIPTALSTTEHSWVGN
jgi:hypothetical protein